MFEKNLRCVHTLKMYTLYVKMHFLMCINNVANMCKSGQKLDSYFSQQSLS